LSAFLTLCAVIFARAVIWQLQEQMIVISHLSSGEELADQALTLLTDWVHLRLGIDVPSVVYRSSSFSA